MAAKEEETGVSLREMFDRGLALHERVEQSEEPSNSENLQVTFNFDSVNSNSFFNGESTKHIFACKS